ncbi:trypsin-like serine protease [Lysinibacillus sphaericus]|uniref:Trypsin-like serine protease n=1 Tax=Lysinibacillus sphaericus TaxID=1421 RepID=A0A544U7U1_LYSSH|nr:trypsin-like serine protease [Lysinibacillus sp. SDF0037]TQR27481.1 trypsin-like serine protease [Lysinibacillus sp. SDF0037]
MNKLFALVTALICCMILLVFNNQAFANEHAINAEEISYKQEAQIELFNKLTEKANMTQMTINIEDFGDLFFDENERLHFKYKESAVSTNQDLQQLLVNLRSNGIEVEASTYTHKDLFEQQMIIYQEIKDYYGSEGNLPTISLVSDIFEEKVKFSYDSLEEDLLVKLRFKYGDILEFEKKEFETIQLNKSQKGNWTNLGAGIAIDGSNCSVAGIAIKNGNYFLITAAHCFSGTVASDGTGRRVTQNSYYVGRQHAQAQGVNLDFGLVKIMDNTLSGGRYATNGIRISTDNSITEVFDNKLIAASPTSPAFSQVVCRAGINTAKQCGRVIQKGTITNGWDDNKIKKVSVVVPDNPGNYSTNGDSGGAVYSPNTTGNTLTGVHVGSNASYGYFTDIMDGLNYYSASLYTSNSNIKIAN